MKTLKKMCFFFLPLVLILSCWGDSGSGKADNTVNDEKAYYGIEINGVLCGYNEYTANIIEQDGKKMKQEKSDLFLMLSLFGSPVNTEMNMLSYVDPGTTKCNYYSIDIKQGNITRQVKVEIKDGEATITSALSSEPTKIKMTADIIFGEDELLNNLKNDFSNNKTTEKTYKILEVMDGKVRESTFTKIGTEKIELVGKTYDAVIFNQFTQETGIKIKWWYDLEKSELLKFEVNNRKVFKTNHRVVDKIKVSRMDEAFFTKANVSIADIQAISYMKLKVRIEPTGVQISPADLDVPGQSFTGTVNNNIIEGIMEIEHKKYNGEEAPLFPPDFRSDESLNKYLQHDSMVESNDPVLIEKAKEITAGASNSWEAARRLSKWVAENISYAIPGGGTARKTYDLKAGECGAHSFLMAAFCRAVGIPARVVWGGMYAPNFGGGFGQHGWNEIYMGKAGWIPIDTTAFEEDFLDSGHIRISEFQSVSTAFNAKKIEILDYKVGSKKMGDSETVPEEFKKYIGNYENINGKRTFNVKVQEGNLVVVVRGNLALPLNQPDQNGLWYCKIAKHLYFIFKEDDQGNVTQMHLHQLLYIPKKSNPTEPMDDVPDKFKPYLGEYYFAPENLNLKVFYENGTLAVDDPNEKEKIKLYPTGEENKWIDHYNKNTVSFEFDDTGNAKAMKADVVDKFNRI